MAWITPDPNDLEGRLTAIEISTLKTIQQEQGDPLPDTMAQITARLRSACAQGGYPIGNPVTSIPQELEDAFWSLVAWRLASRFPQFDELFGKLREMNYEDAKEQLRSVMEGKMPMEAPDEETDQNFKGAKGAYGNSGSGDRMDFTRL